METKTKIKNRLRSDLTNCLNELERGSLTRAEMLDYFSEFLLDAKVDSRIVVEVLEQFGDEGKDQAMAIKVNEGW